MNKNKEMSVNNAPSIETFSFGEAITITDASQLWDLFEVYFNGQYYEYPFSVTALSKLWRQGVVHLKSSVQLKRNVLVSTLVKNKYISRRHFSTLVNDYLWFGNCFLERIDNVLGEAITLKPSPAKFTRKTKNDRFLFLKNGLSDDNHTFKKGSILHVKEPDINQEIYGIPEWYAVIETALLNEAATKFRLRYYQNGSHAGYILYMTDESTNDGDINKLKKALKESKGPGNFKNMMIYAPGGKKDGIQVLPISEVTAKDEFWNIKRVTRDDQIASTRTPPNLMGVVPENNAGFGSVESAAQVYNRNEIQNLQNLFADEINDFLDRANAIEFEPYLIKEAATE